MLVTEALDIKPLSSRFRLQSKPAIVHSLQSTFLFTAFSFLRTSSTSSVVRLDTKEVFDAPYNLSVAFAMTGEVIIEFVWQKKKGRALDKVKV